MDHRRPSVLPSPRPPAIPGLLAALVLPLALLVVAFPVLVPAAPAAAQEEPEADPFDPAPPPMPEPEEETGFAFDIGFEAKAHFRSSDENRFPVGFPFEPEMLPVGEREGFEETVDPGEHFEVSTLTVFLDATWGETITAHAKVDVIDLYDRNPTSEDRTVDVDEAWVRFGREAPPAVLPERPSAYLKVGKMPKFERQDDRHLESYGLVSTAFNRFEDTGVELGVDLGRHVYLKASATQGNPLFIRDPNALAGDNGISDLRQTNPDPALGTGIVIFYDAEVEDLDVDGELELGAGLGVRWGSTLGGDGGDLLLWGFERDLADTVELEGTFYGGDLDLLRGPLNLFPFPGLDGKTKREVGGNLWIYEGGFTFFGQYADQEIAGLERRGWEAEVAWSFDLPLVASVGGRQLFPFIAPAVRFSRLENDFVADPAYPAPSVTWDWDKIDFGLRLGIIEGIDLTLEYARNEFQRAAGEATNDEFLTTLRFSR